MIVVNPKFISPHNILPVSFVIINFKKCFEKLVIFLSGQHFSLTSQMIMTFQPLVSICLYEMLMVMTMD